MSYVSHVGGENRVFDPIYDPLFIVASKKDAWRANTYALSKSAPIHVLSNYSLMFSDLPKESRSIYLRQDNLLPHFRFQGGGDATSPDSGYISKQISQVDVLGKYRGCYFHHSSEDSKIINLKLDLPESSDEIRDETPEKKIKNVGCQTCYRESSAQTRPYQPDAIIGPGQNEEPEVLRISKLITGDNQPGEFETKIVERARRRRLWEKELPTLCSEKDSKSRAVVLEAFEWEEWLSREEEIEDVQNMRLELIVRLLQKRNRCFELKSVTKLENSTKRIEEKRTQQLEKLQRNHERELRKLEAKHNSISKRYKKANIVEEHVNHTSELYGPQLRFGVNPSRRHYVGFRKKFCARLEKLDKQIRAQPSLICPLTKYDDLAKPKELQKEITQGFCSDANLKKLYESLKSLRSRGMQKSVPRCLLQKNVIVNEIPETPVGVECDLVVEANYQAAVYLQKIIKGRAVQNVLYKGKEMYKGLIDELKSTKMLTTLTQLYPEEARNIERRKIAARTQHKHLKQILKSEKEIKEVLTESEASIIGMLLDFLEKELKRLYEQRKIHALYMLAEKERKKREAFEAGKRQRENKRREEHEEIYKTLTKSSRDTATLYLENVLIEETNLKAEKDARSKIEAMARRIDLAASKSGKYRRPQEIEHGLQEDDENLIADIVNDFVFPEVKKRLARKRMEIRQRRYLLAAHKQLYSHVEKIFPKDIKFDERPDLANEILTELINKAVDSEDALTELCPEENVARHEAMAAIRKIIKRVLPGERKWKTSAERIVSATISELTHMAVNATKDKEGNNMEELLCKKESSDLVVSGLFENVLSETKSVLWERAAQSVDEKLVEVHMHYDPTHMKIIPENYDLLSRQLTQKVISLEEPESSEITIHESTLGRFSEYEHKTEKKSPKEEKNK